MNLKQNKGFSLIELMVVVAIIGILATVAVPNFMTFQAKAKQSNAKVELSAIYTAEQAIQMEYNTYHANLAYIGFVPDGCPQAGGVCPGTSRLYTSGFDATTVTPVLGGAAIGGKTGSRYLANAGVAIALAGGGDVTTATAFSAFATGKISSQIPGNDVWQIDQTKFMQNSTVGY